MRIRDFDFELPVERIAQSPSTEREQARLYVLPRPGELAPAPEARVADLPELLEARFPEGVLVVVNDTRVIPARLHGHKPSGGRVELLLLERLDGDERAAESSHSSTGKAAWSERWSCLGGASKAIRPGLLVALDGERPPTAEVLAVRGAEVEVRFGGDEAGGLLASLERIGEVPLPPYIERTGGPSKSDRDRYQTVYAKASEGSSGSAAAPTAGLHFSPSVLSALAARGIERVALTLHVGLGTFSPLRLPDDAPLTEIGHLHLERYSIPEATARAIAEARAAGKKILAVGTTTVRALESAAAVTDDEGELLHAGAGETRIFISPGHRFRVVDALLTNFHLPRSSLLMLVAALAGRERLLTAYADAVARGYRFYSYGDAMLVT